LALVTPLFGGKKVISPLVKDDQEMARYLKGLMESGAFKPVIDRRYRLDQISRRTGTWRQGRRLAMS
jgi:hypothetical protein